MNKPYYNNKPRFERKPKPARILSKKEVLQSQKRMAILIIAFFGGLLVLTFAMRGLIFDTLILVLFVCGFFGFLFLKVTNFLLSKGGGMKDRYVMLSDLQRTDPFAVEEYIANIFRKMGFDYVRITPQMGDGGIDVLMEKNGVRYGVQVKRYAQDHYVQVEEVRAVIGSREQLHLDKVIFVTTSSYTRFVWENIRKDNIYLIDGRGLDNLGSSVFAGRFRESVLPGWENFLRG